jgi:hypothetical protein
MKVEATYRGKVGNANLDFGAYPAGAWVGGLGG